MRLTARPVPCAAILLAACASPAPTPKAAPARPVIAAPTPPTAPAPAVQTATLTGLYEGGVAARRNQLCMIERPGRTSFGLVTWGTGAASCSGSGRATRYGDRLLLTMAGDSSCVVDARIEGRRVTISGVVPQGCAYYCAAGATLAGVSFDKTGGTEADALRGQDLIGDPLCA